MGSSEWGTECICETLSVLGQIVSIVPSGLSLYPNHSYLGASGDGWVCQDGICVGMLQVKCPFSIEKDTVTSIHPVTLAQNPTLCLEMHGELPTLKRTQILSSSSGGIGHYRDALVWFNCLDRRCMVYLWSGYLADNKELWRSVNQSTTLMHGVARRATHVTESMQSQSDSHKNSIQFSSVSHAYLPPQIAVLCNFLYWSSLSYSPRKALCLLL